MSPLGRALLGAVLGALLTLALHPASRPFVLGAASRVTPKAVVQTVDMQSTQVQPPEDLLGASLWLQLGLERLVSGHGLSPAELKSLLEVADAAIERERQNAFWYQAKTVLLLQSGKSSQAEAAWHRAAIADYWKDFQTERLQRAQGDLAAKTDATQAWQYAFVYYARSSEGALLIERTARALLADSDYQSEAGRSMRYSTLLNGDLMRKGGRSIPISLHGANMVELSAYPSKSTGVVSPKRLWVGQNELLTSLIRAGKEDQAGQAREVFSQNEGWNALVNLDEYEGKAEELSRLAVLNAGVPIAMVLVCIAGVLVWLCGKGLQRALLRSATFPTMAVAAAAVALSLIVFLLTRNVAASLATALSLAFLLVSPKHLRQVECTELGPLFAVAMLVIAVAVSMALMGHIVAHSGPAVALAPAIELPEEYYGQPTLLGLGLMALAMISVVAPLWALFYRVGTPVVASAGLRTVGAAMAVGGLVLTVILGPVCVYADRSISATLAQLVANEPVYYLVQ